MAYCVCGALETLLARDSPLLQVGSARVGVIVFACVIEEFVSVSVCECVSV